MNYSNIGCIKTSNNKYPNCPPRMDDGRHFTDYRPNCHMNNLYRYNNTLTNSFVSRMHLTHNALDLMKYNRQNAHTMNDCGPCQQPYQTGTMMKESSARVVDDPTVPCGHKVSQPIHPHVVSHTSQPLACKSWNTHNTQSVTKTPNCCSNISDMLDTYSLNNKQNTRLTVPSGGVLDLK